MAFVFVSIQGENGFAGGGILNRGADIVGLSNLFGSKMDWVWRSLTATLGEIFPGLPLVGYEHGNDLAAAKLAGFEDHRSVEDLETSCHGAVITDPSFQPAPRLNCG